MFMFLLKLPGNTYVVSTEEIILTLNTSFDASKYYEFKFIRILGTSDKLKFPNISPACQNKIKP